MPYQFKSKATRYGPGEAPPAGIQAADQRSSIARKLKRYTQGSDAEQFDTVKQNLAQINFYLSEEAVNIAKGQSQLDISKLVQLCTALGISYDKLYSKRDTGIKPLAFPPPLLAMVKQGLLLGSPNQSTQKVSSTIPIHEESASANVQASSDDPAQPVNADPAPVPRSRYKTEAMRKAHAALCPTVPATLPPRALAGK